MKEFTSGMAGPDGKLGLLRFWTIWKIDGHTLKLRVHALFDTIFVFFFHVIKTYISSLKYLSLNRKINVNCL